MFVRWKAKHADRLSDTDGYLNIAYLAESKRINGKPRQKTRYLGSIRGRALTEVTSAYAFWRCVQAKLQTSYLSDDERISIEQQLAKRVPRPSEQEFQEALMRLRWEGATYRP